MLVTYAELSQKAHQEHWAIGAFQAWNLETAQAVIEAAEELRSPVIIETSQKTIDYAGLHEMFSIISSLSTHTRIPVALSINDAQSYNIAEQCITQGYTGLTRDAAMFSLKKNCEEIRRVVELGHRHQVMVEGVLGGEEVFTMHKVVDAKTIRNFVQETGVDILRLNSSIVCTISSNKIQIDRETIKNINRAIPKIKLSLSEIIGLSDNDVVASIRSGVVKISVDTELRFAFAESLRNNLGQDKTHYDPRGILGPAKDAVKAKVKEKIILFGSSGKA